MHAATFAIESEDILAKALWWADQFETACLLHSNSFDDPYATLNSLLAVGIRHEFIANGDNTFSEIQAFQTKHPQEWMLGFFGYDLKKETENLPTILPDHLAFPDAYFFIPETILTFEQGELTIQSVQKPDDIFESIVKAKPDFSFVKLDRPFQKRMTKAGYMQAFEALKEHIRRGDIYEVNLCQEFFQEECNIHPLSAYWELNRVSPMPFSTFFKMHQHYILSASPERFVAKRGDILLSQPIKGTAKRGQNMEEDQQIIRRLQNDPKEQAENVMIVDLVRNDLTRRAKPGSVAAERKPQVHTFPQVHQLISTITCEIDPEIPALDAIKNVFPPGSMTGAPKVSAMKLCDRYEASKRGVYSGAFGYFSPNGDFDFNVVIRTLLYNQKSGYLSFHTGGAITIDAMAEREYEECLVKAQGILNALGTEIE